MKVLQITSDYLPNPLWGMGWHVAQLQNALADKVEDFYIATAFKSRGEHKNIITTKEEDDLELLSQGKHEIFNDYNNFNIWQERLADSIQETALKFDIAHVHNWMSWITAEHLKKRGIVKKSIVTFHFLQKQYELMTENPIPTFHKEIIEIEMKSMENADAIILLSDSQINLVKNLYDEKFLQKAKLIPHSVNFDTLEFEEITKSKSENKCIDIVFIGRIELDKGIIETLKAFEKVKQLNIRLNIIGEGPLLSTLKEKYSNNEQIIFHGYLNRGEIKKILSSAHIFCMPSSSENLPLTVLEAMFFGVVPIFTEGPSVPNLYRNGEHGLTIPLDKVEGKYIPNQEILNKSLLQIIFDVELRSKFSKAAYKYAIEKYSTEKMSEEILKLYSSII